MQFTRVLTLPNILKSFLLGGTGQLNHTITTTMEKQAIRKDTDTAANKEAAAPGGQTTNPVQDNRTQKKSIPHGEKYISMSLLCVCTRVTLCQT